MSTPKIFMTTLIALALFISGCGGNEPATTPTTAKLTFSRMSTSLPAKVETIKVIAQLPAYLNFDNISTVTSPVLTGKNDVSVSGRYSATTRQLTVVGAKPDGIKADDFAELNIGLKNSSVTPNSADFGIVDFAASGFDNTGSTIDLSFFVKPKLSVNLR